MKWVTDEKKSACKLCDKPEHVQTRTEHASSNMQTGTNWQTPPTNTNLISYRTKAAYVVFVVSVEYKQRPRRNICVTKPLLNDREKYDSEWNLWSYCSGNLVCIEGTTYLQ
jgi:hypothetical protein